MISAINIKMQNIILHKIGNKLRDEGLIISNSYLNNFESLQEILINYFISPFISDEYFHLYHDSELSLNEVYIYTSRIFDNPSTLHEQSVKLAKHLYNQSVHPKIKGGEFYVVYLKDCILDNNTVDAIGLFKSENKDTYLKVHSQDGNFNLESEKGININKLDKGCLIFNIEKDNGYIVAVVDNTNKGVEAKYWTEDFLHIRPRKDSYNQTQNMISIYKNFISQLPEDNGKMNKIILMNKGIEALKKESVNINSFATQVFEQPELETKFKQYKETYQKERDIEIDDTFKPAPQVLKRKTMGKMATIKLDKNFDINIHGGEQYIERGYDEKRGMYYYQFFSREEK